ncbi:uncharacterized protein (DUF1919 family) [Arcicella rosea]|uniref:DUF1919 domain-containing protein n=1 Tax=Arcicella rosea TaxID=502909 RepID=UPI00345C94C5
MWLKKIYKKKRDSFYQQKRSKYFDKLNYFINEETTIISNNCLAGFIYQDLNRAYSSPTAGLYFFFPDYIEFLSDLESNLKLPLVFVESSKYQIGNDRLKKSKHYYPVALLGGKFEIHFLHYETIQEAKSKWERRVSRVNLNNLLVLGTELDLCTENDILAFEKLPFKKKFFFTKETFPTLKSTITIESFRENPKIGDPLRNGDILYKHLLTKFENEGL